MHQVVLVSNAGFFTPLFALTILGVQAKPTCQVQTAAYEAARFGVRPAGLEPAARQLLVGLPMGRLGRGRLRMASPQQQQRS